MLNVKVITPEKVIFNETVESVTVPTTTGVITVLDKHIPLVSTINLGEMSIKKDGTGINFSVFKGVVSVQPHRKGLTEMTVLLERTEKVEDLDEKRAEEALARAKQLAEEKEDDTDFSHFESLIEKELNRVRLARKYGKIRI